MNELSQNHIERFLEEKLGHLMKILYSFNIFEIAMSTKLQKCFYYYLKVTVTNELKEFQVLGLKNNYELFHFQKIYMPEE